MECEVCGKKIHGSPTTILMEGTEMKACHACEKYGTVVKPKLPPATVKSPLSSNVRSAHERTARAAKNYFAGLDNEVVEDYDIRIKEAREKKGWSQEDLAHNIKERVPLIKKIERKGITPEENIIEKLERALDIKLVESVGKDDTYHGGPAKDLTLGDVVKIKRR